MKFDLVIGGNEIFWEFAGEDDRDKVWEDLTTSYKWERDWAERVGCRGIILKADAMPMAYRWKCTFEK